MNDEVEISDKLQLKSLIAFMHQLGYSYLRGEFLGSNYSGAPIVRFNTAVRIYNNSWHKVENGFVPVHHVNVLNSPFETDAYNFNKLMASRIVSRVKLQSNKRGYIKCQSNKGTFVDTNYYQLFEGELV